MKRLTLDAWIDQLGQTAVARLLGISPMTVNHWRHKKTHPKVTVMRKIKKVTRGRVGYEQIIDGDRR